MSLSIDSAVSLFSHIAGISKLPSVQKISRMYSNRDSVNFQHGESDAIPMYQAKKITYFVFVWHFRWGKYSLKGDDNLINSHTQPRR